MSASASVGSARVTLAGIAVAAKLDNAHRDLDKAVAAAYGWTDYAPEMPEELILQRLLALNLERAAKA